MLVKVICNTCNKSVICRNLIECSLCLTMVHLKCNNLNVVDAEIIKNTGSDRFWICMFCSNNLFPFATLNDHKLYQTLSQSNNHYSDSFNSYSTNTCSTLKPPKNLNNSFNEFNNFSSQQNKTTENIINYKYFDTEEIQGLNNLNHKNALILFHINTCSLSKNIEALEYLLDKTKIDFDVRGINESRIKKDKKNPKKTNVSVGCIYRHPHMDLNEFNDYYINNLLDKLSKENKTVFLLGDFNIDLLNYDQHSRTNTFLDSLSSHMLLPPIVQPARIRNNSKTLK